MNDKIKELVAKSAMQGAQQAAVGAHGHAIDVLARALYQAGADAARLEARLKESEESRNAAESRARIAEMAADGERSIGFDANEEAMQMRYDLEQIEQDAKTALARARALPMHSEASEIAMEALESIAKLAHDKTDEQTPF